MTHRIQLIDEFVTSQYINQQGWLDVTQHQLVVTVLEQRTRWYQESQSYEELEEE
jgi:hypothetical protein